MLLIFNSFVLSTALGPLIDSESESSDDEGEISSPEVKALQAAASKVLRVRLLRTDV